MTQKISDAHKEYYWRDLLPEYEEKWGKIQYDYIKNVHDGIGNRQNRWQRFVRMLLFKSFQYGDALRLSSDSVLEMSGGVERRARAVFIGAASASRGAFTWSDYKTGAGRTIFRCENTFIGNAYAAFLVGSTYAPDGVVTRCLRTGALHPSMYMNLSNPANDAFIMSEEDFEFNFKSLPDGRPYVSSLRL